MKRLNYFKGEFLKKEDFDEEQAYHINMLREHNKNLHQWGIAIGLDVEASGGKVTVKSGMATDSEGHQIILDNDTPKQIPDNSEFYLTISYHNEPTDLRNDNPGEAQFTRIEEKPAIDFLRTNESFDRSIKLVLAKIIPDKEKIKIDKSERQIVRLNGDLSAHRIEAENGLQIDSDETSLSGSLVVSGKVGIGTDAPAGKLDVRGDIQAGNSDLYFTKVDHNHTGFGNTTGYAAIENAANFDALMILGRAGTSKGRYVRLWDYLQINGGLDVSGNVGIGTSTPSAKLNVDPKGAGEILLGNPNWKEGGYTSLTMGISKEKEGYAWIRSIKSSGISPGDICLNPEYQTGNVGIGTASPSARLDVIGNIKGSNDLIIAGKVGIGTVDPKYSLDIKAVNIKLGLEKNGGGQLIIANNPNDNAIYLEACDSIGNGNASALVLSGNSAQNVPYLALNANNTNINGNTSINGNVGIGTTNPQRLLHLKNDNGNCLVLQYANASKGGGTVSLDFQTHDAGLPLYPTASVQAIDNNWSSHLAFFTKEPGASQNGLKERLRINNDGKVGIGTDAPAGKLDVRGDIQAGNSDLYFTKVDHNYTGFGNTAGYAAIENAANFDALMILGRSGTPKGRYVRLWDYLQINGGMDVTGNVGIGTDKPSERLEVNGTVKANKFVGDGSGLTGITGVGASKSQWADVNGGISYNAGNVGIGTPDIKRKLHVEGDNSEIHCGGPGAGFSFASRSSKSFVDSPGKGERWVWYSYGDPGIAYLWSGKNLLSINKDGNFGIGTDTPGGKLDVRGDIQAGNSDLYFTKVDHNHTGFGNTKGYAAIENAANFDALMILGRAGTEKGRYVRLWDYLQINGGLDVTGNVGIGTTTPSAKLEVNGDLKVSGRIIQEDWKAANLLNGWKIFREADKIHNSPGYFIDKSGIVHLIGAVSGGVVGKPIFNLPEGYRPARWELQPVLTSPDTSGRCDIMPDGNVILMKGDSGWVFLDGITFRAK